MLGAMIGTELLAVGAPAQERVPSPVPTGPPTHAIRRTSGAILVDGILDEKAWSTAVVVNPAFETYPGNNLPARVATECLLAYDDDHLYVAFRAHDGEPAKIRAHLTDRDAAYDDDFVGVVIDTFNDERRGYEFFVNPLGVQMDLVQDDVNKNEDPAWDAIWASAGRVDAGGLHGRDGDPVRPAPLRPRDGPQTWGIDVLRVYPRDQRFIFRAQPQDRNQSCYLCQVSKLTGLEGIRRGKNVELDPTLTGVRSEEREDVPHGPWRTIESKADPGISARWGFTPNLTALAAINPDFSQVEADAAQLDVNTDFALFYPEKRPFFLEGADFFETPGSAIYTRTVADPAWGVKLSGKEGRTAVGALRRPRRGHQHPAPRQGGLGPHDTRRELAGRRRPGPPGRRHELDARGPGHGPPG